jgi:hypothetical protein
VAEVGIKNHAAFIWSVADLLRGDCKQSEYGKVILPLTVLRRLDCVLEPTKDAVLQRAKALKGQVENVDPIPENVAGQYFFNTSPLDFRRLLDDPVQITGNLRGYIAGFSAGAREVIDKFDFDGQITRLAKDNLLYLVISKFADVDLHPDVVSNSDMGAIYEELVRKFSELSNETAGEHFTPREVVRLMVNLLFAEDDEMLTGPGVVRTLFDPACGTGGMLSVAEDHLRSMNPSAKLEVAVLFDFLLNRKDKIEADYGGSLMWEALPGRRASRIADYAIGDAVNVEEHDQYIDWLFDALGRLRSAFEARGSRMDGVIDTERVVTSCPLVVAVKLSQQSFTKSKAKGCWDNWSDRPLRWSR